MHRKHPRNVNLKSNALPLNSGDWHSDRGFQWATWNISPRQCHAQRRVRTVDAKANRNQWQH